VLPLEPVNEIPYRSRLLPVETGGPNTRFQRFKPGSPQSPPTHEAGLAKLAQRQRSIMPRGVLCEDSSQNNFQAGARRPPLLRSESLEESGIIAGELLARRSLRHVGHYRHTQKLYRACRKVNEPKDRVIR